MRGLWLSFTDKRIRAARRAVERSGIGLGDLAAGAAEAPVFFTPLNEAMSRAASAPPSTPAAAEALSAARDFTALLGKTFSDMRLHAAVPDAAIKEALFSMQRACAVTPALLNGARKTEAAETARALCAGGRKGLRLAKRAADGGMGGFPQNLKFSSIYSGLDAVFDALERYAQALYKA